MHARGRNTVILQIFGAFLVVSDHGAFGLV